MRRLRQGCRPVNGCKRHDPRVTETCRQRPPTLGIASQEALECAVEVAGAGVQHDDAGPPDASPEADERSNVASIVRGSRQQLGITCRRPLTQLVFEVDERPVIELAHTVPCMLTPSPVVCLGRRERLGLGGRAAAGQQLHERAL